MIARPDDAEYRRCVELSERVAWKISDVFPEDARLDFTMPFLPAALMGKVAARLSDPERLLLNHIRANSYVNLFIFVEEYIIANAMMHAHAALFGSTHALRALLRFADEEVKHQELFRTFAKAFAAGFSERCDVLENAGEVAGFIMSRSPLAVMVTTLHLELVTQQHYVSAFRSASNSLTEAHFRSLFKHHWIEESQHAKIDMLEIRRLASDVAPERVQSALDDYAQIVRAFDAVLHKQVDLDLATFQRALGRALPGAELDQLRRDQHGAYRQAFLLDGLGHPHLRDHTRLLHASADTRLDAMAAELSSA